ncbi:MAG: type IV toxin-antitoxin system AbiEi family antitoxin domain-containing protein [Lewinellaceae bacterium]|nr:type IV toxin-antitoxin system AbiEi family antitoxin domain-containing protein [Lewinellaceae bacterium]
MLRKSKGKSSKSRQRLSRLIREGGELFTVDKAAEILGMSNDDAAKTLARWRNQGWLTRIKRGVYAAVPLEADTTAQAIEDAWILIPKLFEPAYVGGWSAAEHWDLTEQIFKDIYVYTSRPVAKRKQTYHNISFVVTHIPVKYQFGTKPVWKKEIKILVSDPTRTIVDILADPKAGGGIQHTVDCLREYFKSTHFNESQLIEYATRLGNGAVFKRLGFLASQLLGEEAPLIHACLSQLTKGNAKLDPSQKADKLVTKWRLFIPINLQIGSEIQ